MVYNTSKTGVNAHHTSVMTLPMLRFTEATELYYLRLSISAIHEKFKVDFTCQPLTGRLLHPVLFQLAPCQVYQLCPDRKHWIGKRQVVHTKWHNRQLED